MRSIQSIIFIRLFAVILIFFSVVSAVAYFLTNEAIRQFVVSDSSTSLSFIISNVKTNYQSDLTVLDQIAEMKGFLPYQEATARNVLRDFLSFPNIYNTVHMYRADGALLFAERRSNMGPYQPKDNFYKKDAEFIALAEKVIKEKRSHASDVLFTPKGTLYQTYVTPVFADAGKAHVFGILSGAVFPRLQKIDHLLRGLQMGEENFILITDSSGRFITSDGITDKDANAYLQAYTDQATRLFFEKGAVQPFIDENTKVGKSSYIVTSLPIEDLKLVVTLGVNIHRIETNSKELSYRLLVALVAGLLLSLVSSIVVGDRLAKPFRQVADSINEINKGNLAARVHYAGDDEIGYLSKTINLLAEKIQKSEYLGNLWSVEEEQEKQEAESDGERDEAKS